MRTDTHTYYLYNKTTCVRSIKDHQSFRSLRIVKNRRTRVNIVILFYYLLSGCSGENKIKIKKHTYKGQQLIRDAGWTIRYIYIYMYTCACVGDAFSVTERFRGDRHEKPLSRRRPSHCSCET